MKKMKYMLLFVTLLILLVGVVSATEISDDVTDSDSITEEAVTQNTHKVSDTANSMQENIADIDVQTSKSSDNKLDENTTKTIAKNTNTNLKTAAAVTNWEELRSAVNNAYGQTIVTINLENGTYKTNDPIIFNKSVAIIIQGNGQTIDGNEQQVFIVQRGEVYIHDITIKNAASKNGGAIYNRGLLTITKSTFTNNTANNLVGCGGAISNEGYLEVKSTTFTNNLAASGGAIHNGNDGLVKITNCTFTNNNGTFNSKGCSGGAIANLNGSVTMTDSRLTNNRALMGGAVDSHDELNIKRSTFTNNKADFNGGAIESMTKITVQDSSFTDNQAMTGGAIYSKGDLSLTRNKFTNNRATVSNETIEVYGKTNSFYGNVYNSTQISLKKGILSLENDKDTYYYGEGVRLKYYIELNHPNYYDDNIPETLGDITLYVDGEKKVSTRYDNYILSNLTPGNHEIYFISCQYKSNTVKITVKPISNWQELREVVQYAEKQTKNMTLKLSNGNFTNMGTIKWINPDMTLTIDGNGQIIDGNGLQVFYINGRSSMVLKNITIMNAKSTLGGAIYNDGRLTVIQSTLRNNSGDYGGAIENLGRLTVTQSTLTGNTAELGGAISNFGPLTITESILADNTASDFGGAIRNYQTLINVVKSNFTGNKAGNNGGAIFSYGNANLTNNTFTRNTAKFNDTIYLEHRKAYAEGNVYNSTDIRLKPLKLRIKDNQDTFTPYDEVVLNYTITLINPEYYDSDILERLDDIKIYVNGVEYDTTGYENYMLTNLKPGDYTVYITTCNQKSNNVTFKIIEINDINLTTWDVEMVQGRSVTLSAIVDYKNSTINQGQVYFEIDGEVLSDENGSILYAHVKNNRADLPYDMPEDISLGNHTLTALYLYDDSILATDDKTLTIIENIPEGAGGGETPSEEGKQGRNRHYTRPYETIHLTVTAVHEIIAGNTVIPAENVLTLGELGEIFNLTFTNGHLLVYIDGQLVYNGTVGDDLTTVILQIIEKFLGKHEIKVEFTDSSNQTKTYTENVTIS